MLRQTAHQELRGFAEVGAAAPGDIDRHTVWERRFHNNEPALQQLRANIGSADQGYAEARLHQSDACIETVERRAVPFPDPSEKQRLGQIDMKTGAVFEFGVIQPLRPLEFVDSHDVAACQRMRRGADDDEFVVHHPGGFELGILIAMITQAKLDLGRQDIGADLSALRR